LACCFPAQGVESESEDYRASGEVRTGRWKVPTYKDYLDLFRSLLSCDQMMESLLADEAFLFVNSSFQNLNRLLYDEFVKSVLKIIEKLDLTLEKQNVGGHEVRGFVNNNFPSFLYQLSLYVSIPGIIAHL